MTTKTGFDYAEWVLDLAPWYFRRKTRAGRVCALLALPITYPIHTVLFLGTILVLFVGFIAEYVRGENKEGQL